MPPKAVFRTSASICSECGGFHEPEPETPVLNPAERVALTNGWTLDAFRLAMAQLALSRPITMAAAARDAATTIPAAPDQHARLLASLPAAPGARELIQRHRAAGSDDIPAAPDQHARILAARQAGGR